MNLKLFFRGLSIMLLIMGHIHQGYANEGHHIVGSDPVTVVGADGGAQPQGEKMGPKAVEIGNKVCPVSGNKIPVAGEKGDMGEAVRYEYNGKIYNLCCKMCVKDFKRNPEKYSKIAEEGVAKENVMDTEHEEHQGQESNHGHSGHKH